jgi:hypothetical protein
MNDYIILTNWDHDALARQVREKLRQGYIPVGGVSIASPNPGQYVYAQALVKA